MAASHIRLFRESDATDSRASGCPSLDFDHDFAALLVQEFLRHRHRLISGRGGASARNLESVSRENGFALIFVQSCHGWVLFRVKTPNVQRTTSNVQLRSADLSVRCWVLSVRRLFGYSR